MRHLGFINLTIAFLILFTTPGCQIFQGSTENTKNKKVQKEPKFPGGEDAMKEFIKNELNYPEKAKENKVTGQVVVYFVVYKDGSISNIKIKKGVSKALNKEAKQVIREMPNWEPGRLNGKVVRSSYEIPINFRLN